MKNMKSFASKIEHANYFQQVARTEWFRNHKVVITTADSHDVTIVDFAAPGTRAYAIRYIYAGHYVYVSGDLGSAVFNCTWKTVPDQGYWKDLWYIYEKLEASKEKTDFDASVCRSEISHNLLEPDKKGNYAIFPEKWGSDQREAYRELMSAARDCSSLNQWSHAVQQVASEHDINALDADYWEWLYNAGSVMPPQIVGIITGLQMVARLTSDNK